MFEIFGVPSQALFGQLLLGLINGSFYALLSLGLAVIFGMLNIINFTHGAQYMMGAFAAYLLLRKYGGAGSEKLSAVVGFFGMANWPFVYWSVNIWRTVHPKTTVVPTLPPPMMEPLLVSALAFVGLFVLILAARVRLENRRADLDELYLALED